MQNRNGILAAARVGFLATMFAGVAYAQESLGSSVEKLQAANERIVVLEAQLKELELQQKMQRISAELVGSGTPMAGGSGVGRENVEPTVIAVEGVGDNLEAVLQFQMGVRQRVRIGDQVQKSKVTHIALNEVVLYDAASKKTTRLQFSTGAGTQMNVPAYALDGANTSRGSVGQGSVPMPR